MKFFFSILALLMLSLVAQAQWPGFQLLPAVRLTARQLAVDNLGNFYIVTQTDQLRKYNSAGDSIAIYNDVRRFGKLQAIDVSNPLKVLAYYKDFSTIVILDRLLAVRTSLDLRRSGIVQASAVGLSYDNNVWVFDAVNYQLKKLDEQGALLSQTDDFRTLFGNGFKPATIIDQNNSVYLYDPAIGVYQFDHFGTFQKKYTITGWKTIAVVNHFLVGITDSGLQTFNTRSFQQQQYQFPSAFGSFSSYLIANSTLFGVAKDSIQRWSFIF